jgi:sugar phosphate isomerase/epimerase
VPQGEVNSQSRQTEDEMASGLTRRDVNSLLAGLGLGFVWQSLAKSEDRMPFKLGIITDEITEDVEPALDFISQYSLGYCELRDIWRKNIMNASPQDLDHAKKLIEEHHLKVSDIASPVFKYDLPQMPTHVETRDTFRAHFTDQDSDDLLKKSFELAKFFGATKVRIFAFSRVHEPQKAYPYVRDRLAKAAETARQNGITLVLENEHTCNVGTGKELGRILNDVQSPHLRGNWDAGNAAMLGEVPYPDGYLSVRGLCAHAHVKDVRKDSATGKLSWAPVGGGFIDWRANQSPARRPLRRNHVPRNPLSTPRWKQGREHAGILDRFVENYSRSGLVTRRR